MAKKRRSREFKNNRVIDIETARKARRQKRVLSDAKNRQGERPQKGEWSRRKANKIFRRRAIYSAIFLILFIIIGFSVYNLITLKMEEARVQAELSALTEEREKLKEQLSNIDSDEYIEQKARQELKMIMPGETLYILMDGENDKTD